MRGFGWMAALPIAATAISLQQAEAAIACDVAGNLVANCGFEESTLSPWTNGTLSNLNSNSGTQSSFFDNGPLVQQINGLVIGVTYNVSFYWNNYYDPSDGVEMNVAIGPTSLFTNLGSPNNYVFEKYTATFTATSTSAELSFVSATSGGYGLIDDVVITARTTQDVPEPASLAVLGAGLAGLVGLRRRRRDA